MFEATHSLIRELAAEPGVDGLRIDHPDGLSDPEQYFERLQTLAERPWVVVEKILADHEALPDDWPVHGTTGYRFANLLTGVFVDQAAGERFDAHLSALHRRARVASTSLALRAACSS